MEQITPEAISKHIKDKKVTGSSQHGFMKMTSCLNNLTAFYDEMTSLVDKWGAADTVYIGFSAVFDTVSPNNLPDKLMEYRLDVQIRHRGGLRTV